MIAATLGWFSAPYRLAAGATLVPAGSAEPRVLAAAGTQVDLTAPPAPITVVADVHEHGGGLSLADALDASNLVWATSGDAPWLAQTIATHDGLDAAQVQLPVMQTSARLSTVIEGPGQLTFWWRCGTHWPELDSLSLAVDGAEVRVTRSTSWLRQAVWIPAGAHALAWIFAMESEPSLGDGAWLDEVRWVPGAALSPDIGTQPVSQSVYPGQAVTFSVTAAGTPPLRYQWQRNGAEIPGATHSTLELSNVQPIDVGNYSVIVANACGAVTSAVAALRLISLPPCPSAGTLAGWGGNHWGALDIPAELAGRVVSMAAGWSHTLALTCDGRVFAWGGEGSDYEGVSHVPPGLSNVVAIAAGRAVSLALTADGRVVAWGPEWALPYVTPPAWLNEVVAIAAGHTHGVALRRDGIVIAWGNSEWYPYQPPAGLAGIVAIAAGGTHTLALRQKGTIVAWGMNYSGQLNVPSGLADVVAISANNGSSFALRRDGTVVGWGAPELVGTMPAGLAGVASVSAGFGHSLALKQDGTIVAWGAGAAWGEDWVDITKVPPGLSNITAVSAGERHSLALRGDGRPVITVNPRGATVDTGRQVSFDVIAVSSSPLSYQWLYNGTSIPGATNATLVVPDVQLADAGNYSVSIANRAGTALSAPATLVVLPLGNPVSVAGNQEWPDVASDGTNFFVVWMDRRNGDNDWSTFDIYGARVGGDGQVLDPGGIPICATTNRQWYPSIAFDGVNYFVVWSDDRDQTGTTPALDLYGARVSRDGRVLDTNGIRLTQGEVIYVPTVAFNGTDYLVTGYAWSHHGVRNTFLLGVRVSPAGMVRDPEEIVIHQSAIDYPALVASAGTNWLVVWNGQYSVSGALVRPDGSVCAPIRLTQQGTVWPRGVAAVGGNYFLTTIQSRQIASNMYVQDVCGTWIGPDGRPESTFLIAANTNTTAGTHTLSTSYLQEHPAVAPFGSGALVVWEAGNLATNGGFESWRTDLRGARVARSGGVSPVFPVCAARQEQSHPALAFNGRSAYAAWQDARTASDESYSITANYDIYGARIGLTNGVIPTDGLLVSSQQISPPTIIWFPPLAIVYGTALGVWQLDATADVPGTFSYDPSAGTVLSAGQHTLTARFTPRDTALWAPVTAVTAIHVRRAPLLVAADDKEKFPGEMNPPLTATVTGLVGNDTPEVLGDVSSHLLAHADIDSPPGHYLIEVLPFEVPNYEVSGRNGMLAILPAQGPQTPFATREISGAHVQLVAGPAPGTSVYAIEDQPPAGWLVTNISHDGVFDARTGKVKFGPYYDAAPRTLSYEALPPPGAHGVFAFTGSASADGVNTPVGGDQYRLLVGWHPAECRDARPADWRMEIEEVTAYGAAWRRSMHWIVPPHVIPIDYVTRAGFLWRGGECYAVDAAITNAPFWWVTCDSSPDHPPSPAAAATPAGNPSCSERAIAPRFIPGEPLEVNVTVMPAPSVFSCAVAEQVPPGWTVDEVSDDGEYDAVDCRVKWGPFLDSTPRTLSYRVTPPANACGSVRFGGVSSFDGSSVEIGGVGDLSPGCRLSISSRVVPGPFRLTLVGAPGTRVLIEASVDLVRWTPVAELKNDTGQTVLDADPVTYPQRFYRSRLLE